MSIDGYHVDVMSCKAWAYWTLLVGFLLSLGVGGEACRIFKDNVELHLLKDHLFKLPIFQDPSEPLKTEYSALSIVNMLCSSWNENVEFYDEDMQKKMNNNSNCSNTIDPRIILMTSYFCILRHFSFQSRQPVNDHKNKTGLISFCQTYNCSSPYPPEYISLDEFERKYNNLSKNTQLPDCPSERGPSFPPSQASTTPATSNGAPPSQVNHTTDPPTSHDPSTLSSTPRPQTSNPSTLSPTPRQQTSNPSTLSPTLRPQTSSAPPSQVNHTTDPPTSHDPSTLSSTPRPQTSSSTMSFHISNVTNSSLPTGSTMSFHISNVTNSSLPTADFVIQGQITGLQLQRQIFTLLLVVSVMANIALIIIVWHQCRSRRQIYLQDRPAVSQSHETVRLVLLRNIDRTLLDHPEVHSPHDSAQVVLLRNTELQEESDASGFLSYQAT